MIWHKEVNRFFFWPSQLFLPETPSPSFIYEWAPGCSRVSVSHASILQPAVFRLHVVLIDFSPSPLKCTIDQYSNKSSFRPEKCSFQWPQCLGPTTDVNVGRSSSDLGPRSANNSGTTSVHGEYQRQVQPGTPTFPLHALHVGFSLQVLTYPRQHVYFQALQIKAFQDVGDNVQQDASFN